MTTLEDTLSEGEKDDVEKAKTRSKREKTKYGHLIEDE